MDNKSVLQIPIEDIVPNRFQPRVSFDETTLKELANSIKVHGIIQPLVVRRLNDKYEIIAGERRYRAAKSVGLLSVPAILSELTDGESAEVAIVENIQRKDLTAIEEARSYKTLLEKGDINQDELARKMGLSQSAVSNKLRLLNLSDSVQDAILNEKISERHARSLLKVKEKSTQDVLLNKIIGERLTVKQLEDEIKIMLPEEKIETEQINPEEKEVLARDFFNNPIDLTKFEKKENKFFNFMEETPVNMNSRDIPVVEEEIELLDADFNIPTINPVKKDILKDLEKYSNIIIEESEESGNNIITIKIPK